MTGTWFGHLISMNQMSYLPPVSRLLDAHRYISRSAEAELHALQQKGEKMNVARLMAHQTNQETTRLQHPLVQRRQKI